ncbi:MAG: hypothetical protein WHU10_02155 [Fimbriimonadales bacterium]
MLTDLSLSVLLILVGLAFYELGLLRRMAATHAANLWIRIEVGQGEDWSIVEELPFSPGRSLSRQAAVGWLEDRGRLFLRLTGQTPLHTEDPGPRARVHAVFKAIALQGESHVRWSVVWPCGPQRASLDAVRSVVERFALEAS